MALYKTVAPLFLVTTIILSISAVQSFGNSYSSHLKRNGNTGDTHILKGFDEFGSVPVDLPIDICLVVSNTNRLIAAALHQNKNTDNVMLNFYKQQNGSDGQFEMFFEHTTNNATHLDCVSLFNATYVSIINDDATMSNDPRNGSPLFQIVESKDEIAIVNIVQIFSRPLQSGINLWTYGQNMFLMQSFKNVGPADRENPNCIIYQWSGYHFNILDEIPCFNAMAMEAFVVATDLFVVVANNLDNFGYADTSSFVYQYDVEGQRFMLVQHIPTHGAVDVKYFYFDTEAQRDHFLVFANSQRDDKSKSNEVNIDSVIYKYNKGRFIPFQSLPISSVTRFRPILGANGELLLLASCHNQEMHIYQYNGWKFMETKVQFTGGVFGKGILNMRYTKSGNTTLIVVANSNALSNSVNIYVPKYSVKNDLEVIQSQVMMWCKEHFNKMAVVDLQKVYTNLKSAPRTENGKLIVDGAFRFNKLEAEVARANSLHMATTILNADFVRHLNGLTTTIQLANERLHRLETLLTIATSMTPHKNQDYDLKVASQQASDIPSKMAALRAGAENEFAEDLEIDELVVEEFFTAGSLNGVVGGRILTEYTPNVVLDELIVQSIETKDNLIVDGLIDGVNFHTPNVLFNTGDQTYNGSLSVENLTVTDSLSSVHVNDIPFAILQERLNETPKIPTNIDQLNVDNLIVDGTINGLDLETVAKFTLRNVGEQTIYAPIMVNQLTVDEFIATDQKLSGMDLTNFVSIGNGSTFSIEQDIQFAKPLFVENLIVRNRINNLNVMDGQLNVLRTNADYVQEITGEKTFGVVNLGGPIVLSGKITSPTLKHINPILTINDDLDLPGNFEITGDVTVGKFLHTSNIYGASATFNVNNVLERGLELNASDINTIFSFAQPIRITNLIAPYINEYNPSSFVRTNIEEVQVISGAKTFSGDLTVEGMCDAHIINDINLNVLNATVFKRFADQTINGTAHFKKITIGSVHAVKATFGDVAFHNFLSTNSDQLVTGAVQLEGNVNVNNLEVNMLKTNHQILGYDITGMIVDSVLANSNRIATFVGTKTFTGSFSINELSVNVPIAGIEFEHATQRMEAVRDNLVINGSLVFSKPIVIDFMEVDGHINGVPSAEFGHTWLLTEYDQTFIAPQTLANVLTTENIIIGDDRLNGYNLKELVTNTVWTNRPETFGNVSFLTGFSTGQSILVGGKVGAIKFSQDIITTHSTEPQSFDFVHLTGDLIVRDGLTVADTFNNISVYRVCELIKPLADAHKPPSISAKMATFAFEPVARVYNNIPIDKLESSVWMANRATTLKGTVFFENASLEKDLLADTINDVNLNYMAANYLSRTKPQRVQTEIQFVDGVVFANGLISTDIRTDGPLKSHNSHAELHLNEFNANVLKSNEEQIITGPWSFNEIVVSDRLDDIAINGLSITTDLVRLDRPHNNITGAKHFEHLSIGNVRCMDTCVIQGVDINEWMNNAVYQIGNHTIEGLAVIENPIFYHDIRVNGLVNSEPFTVDEILVTSMPQFINGNLTIITKQTDPHHRISPLSFERLNVDTINDKNVDEFFAHTAHHGETIVIESPLTFRETLTVQQDLRCSGNFYGLNASHLTKQLAGVNEKYSQDFVAEQLTKMQTHLIGKDKHPDRRFSHLKMRQFVAGISGKFHQIRIAEGKNVTQYLIASRLNEILFYRWNGTDSSLTAEFDQHVILPVHKQFINFGVLSLADIDYLCTELFDPFTGIFQQACMRNTPATLNFHGVFEFHANVSKEIVAIRLGTNACVVLYNPRTPTLLSCLPRKDVSARYERIIPKLGVLQALALPNLLFLLISDLKTERGHVELHYFDGKELRPGQMLAGIHQPDRMTLVVHRYNVYLAVKTRTTVEIFQSALKSAASGLHFAVVQTIRAPQPKLVEFTSVGTEMLMYIMSENSAQPIRVYEYMGVAGFVETKSIAPAIVRGEHFVQWTNEMRDQHLLFVGSRNGLAILDVVMSD